MGCPGRGAAAQSFEARQVWRAWWQGAGRSGPRASVGGLMRAPEPGSQTGARASSPKARRVWCARRAILRATESAAPVTTVAVGDLPVVGVIRGARAGRALGRFEQRPAQQR